MSRCRTFLTISVRGSRAARERGKTRTSVIDLTRTTSRLLDDLREPRNDAAWAELDRRYRPIVAALGRRAGLGEADAADAAQETLAEFFRAYAAARYDRSRGRLRQFLIGIARMKIADVQRRRGRGGEVAGDLDTSLPPEADQGQGGAWTIAFADAQRSEVLREAIQSLRGSDRAAEKTLRAFEMVALRHVPVAAVAEELGMTAQEVYLAKSRCLERLRGIIARLEAAYDGD